MFSPFIRWWIPARGYPLAGGDGFSIPGFGVAFLGFALFVPFINRVAAAATRERGVTPSL